MAVTWAVVQNAMLPIDPSGGLPSFVAGMSSSAPSGRGLSLNAAQTLAIAGENLDAVRASCIAHAGVAISAGGILTTAGVF